VARRPAPPESAPFTPDCTRCPRLAAFLHDVRRKHPGYYARAVPSFGDRQARLLVVGLAPGLHGANATGRPFTGDHAGILLYETLHAFGFANRPASVAASDGLLLADCRITNAVRCVPPQNKPAGDEVRACNDYLRQELAMLPAGAVILALGAIAHAATLRALGLRIRDFPFAHNRRHILPEGRRLFDSYHCSRYNTQTRRLTPGMFREVFAAIRSELDSAGAGDHVRCI